MASMNRVRTVFTGVAGAPYYSSHYFTDDGIGSTAQNAITAVDAFWDGLAGNMTQAMSWVIEGDVDRIDDVSGNLLGQWSMVPAGGVGGTVGEMLPRATQGLVRWATGVVVGKRLLRGRTFIPGLLEPVNTTGGVPSSALISLLTTQATQLISTSTCELLVWSRTHGVSEPAFTGTGWNQWATLRSRRD